MAGFRYDDTPVAVAEEVAASHRQAWADLASCGTWWTGPERVALAARARARFAQRGLPPWGREDPAPDPILTPEAEAAVDTIALDAFSVDRAWADRTVAELGDGPYVELIAIVAVIAMVDVFAESVGVDPEPLPEPGDGEPTRERPDGLGDIGAHVPMLEPFDFANVARALSLVPSANALFRTVSVPSYSAPGMNSLTWDTPLSRPQVELVASRVASMNECFY